MPNALLTCPKNPITFWSFDEALKMIDKKSAFPPLGLLTIASMMPPESYTLRLVDINVTPLRDEDLEWADIVITSSMIIHWQSLEEIMARCSAHGVPVLNGGPLPTQYYDEIEGNGVFYLGEAENGFLDIVERMISDPGSTERETIDRRGKFRDLALTPLPRWDLIDLHDYSNMVIQMTRGCPESCTFCNIPSLYGKDTRVKGKSRIIEELDAIYHEGWRGAVMVVDDNFVGNRDKIRAAMEEEVIPWQRERDYPFQFHTQASIRLSDDPDLLEAMYQAGFDKVFAGIESPVEESLKFMGAQKNLQGGAPLLEKIRVMQRTGFEVQAGFIMGLDTDPDDIADRTVAFIRESGIPVAMVGILGVLRDTPDYKRFSRAGRLVQGAKYTGDSGIFNRELSYVPVTDPQDLLDRHRTAVETLNSPKIFFERCSTFFDNRMRFPISKMPIIGTEIKALFRSLWRQGIAGHYRLEYWKFLFRTLLEHPKSFPDAIRLAVQGHHLILTTQQALHVDEMKSFFSEALEHLEHFREGTLEAFQRNVGAYASHFMQATHARFEHFQDDRRRTLHHNAEVLRMAAQEYYHTVREEFRHQVQGPLEKFQREIQGILDSYVPDDGVLPQRAP